MTSSEMLQDETSGQRFRRLAEEKEYKQEALADELHVSRMTIYRYFNDENKDGIPDDIAQEIANLFGVRKEYILCKDDFKTEDELCRHMDQVAAYTNQKPFSDMKAALAYLETLGIHLEPCNKLSLPITSIYDDMETARKYLNKTALAGLLNKNDFSLSPDDFHKKYLHQVCTLEMSAPMPDDVFLSEESFSVDSKSGAHYIFADNPGNPFHVDCTMISYFKAYRDGEYVQNIGAPKVQSFVKELNLYTKFSTDHILLNGDEGNLW